jgi:hypothetical protein
MMRRPTIHQVSERTDESSRRNNFLPRGEQLSFEGRFEMTTLTERTIATGPIMRILKAALFLAAVLIPTYAVAAGMQAFKPGGRTVLISATTTAATVTLQGAGGEYRRRLRRAK